MPLAFDQLVAAIALALGRPAGGLDMESGLDVTEGWDSLKNMEVLLQVETTFRVRFTAQELMALQSVRGIYRCLREKGLVDEPRA